MLKISVIIPNYNRAAIIGQTIENMLSQSLKPHEIIVVDDGSTDNSIEVIQSFGSKVKLIQQSNKGPGAARNAGLKVATGEFIQFMDSDDLASLNKLEVQAKTLLENKADLVYGPWVKVWFKENYLQPENVVLQQKKLPDSRSALFWFLTDWSMVFQQCLVRKDFLLKVGGYREDIKSLEDGDLFVRLCTAGVKITYEPESLTIYRLDDFAKLTASGHGSSQRIVDSCKYYESILDMSKFNNELALITKHPNFLLRIKIFFNDIIASRIDISKFENLSKTQPKLFQILLPLIRDKIVLGIKLRIVGNRWPGSFMSGTITSDQRRLIKELGFELLD